MLHYTFQYNIKLILLQLEGITLVGLVVTWWWVTLSQSSGIMMHFHFIIFSNWKTDVISLDLVVHLDLLVINLFIRWKASSI